MKIFSIAGYELIKLSRDKANLFFIIILPVLFTFFIGMAYGNKGEETNANKIPVGIVIYDKNELVDSVISEIKKDNTINYIKMNEDELISNLKNATVETGFIIPKDFTQVVQKGGIPQIKFLKLPTSVSFENIQYSISSAFLKMQFDKNLSHYFVEKLKGEGIEGNKLSSIMYELMEGFNEEYGKPTWVSTKDVRVYKDEERDNFNGRDQSSFGISAMFVMFIIIFGIGEILEDKKNRTWQRIITTPTSRGTIITGKLLGTFIKGWIQVTILLVLGQFVMGVNFGNSIFSAIIIFSVYLLCLTSMGILLSSLVKTNAQLGAYSSIVIVSTSMLSGCYWPLEIAPVFMQKLAMIFPQYWLVKALSNTVSGNMGIESIIPHLSILLCMGGIFLIISLILGRIKGGLFN